jgi:hypothetical protein
MPVIKCFIIIKNIIAIKLKPYAHNFGSIVFQNV